MNIEGQLEGIFDVGKEEIRKKFVKHFDLASYAKRATRESEGPLTQRVIRDNVRPVLVLLVSGAFMSWVGPYQTRAFFDRDPIRGQLIEYENPEDQLVTGFFETLDLHGLLWSFLGTVMVLAPLEWRLQGRLSLGNKVVSGIFWSYMLAATSYAALEAFEFETVAAMAISAGAGYTGKLALGKANKYFFG